MAEIKGDRGKYLGIFLRYLILILVAIPNLFIFYLVFTPLTVYPVYYAIQKFLDVALVGNILIVEGNIAIEIIRACVAGAAYYFLLILNLSTPGINLGKRAKMILFAFLSLLVLNIARILLLAWLFLGGFSPLVFDTAHNLFWYSLSTVFVVLIWFAEVRIFKIKEIPIYSDLKFLYKKIF